VLKNKDIRDGIPTPNFNTKNPILKIQNRVRRQNLEGRLLDFQGCLIKATFGVSKSNPEGLL